MKTFSTACCIFVAFIAGCAPERRSPVSIWIGRDILEMTVHDAAVVVDGTGNLGLYDPRTRQVTLAGAINETISFCLAVSVGAGTGAAGAGAGG